MRDAFARSVEQQGSPTQQETSAFAIAAQLEATLDAIQPLHSRHEESLRLTVPALNNSYPITLNTSNDWRISHPYFRAGKYFVLNPNIMFSPCDGESGPRSTSEFIETCKRLQEVIFLCDNRHPALHFNPSIHAQGYYLPNTIGCMLGLQELGAELAGRTVLDIGSRNALIAAVALREGASNALVIECDRAQANFFRHDNFPGAVDPSILQADRVELNVALNGIASQVELHQCTIGRMPSREVKGGVAVFNFPDYGMGYYDATPEELRASESRLSSGMSLGYDRRQVEYRESLIADVTTKFTGLQYLIASGGARLPTRPELMVDESEELLKQAHALGWNLLQTIVVSHPCRGNITDYDYGDWNDPKNRVDDTTEFLTFIFERESR